MTQEQKLPPEFKAKWVAALRSGEYKQGRKHLLKDDCYCCLGVACAISDVEIYDEEKEFPSELHDDNIANMPSLLTMPARFDCNKEAEEQPTAIAILAKMNDDGKTFAEIAEYIEQYL